VRATTTLYDPKKAKDEKAKAEEAMIKDRWGGEAAWPHTREGVP